MKRATQGPDTVVLLFMYDRSMPVQQRCSFMKQICQKCLKDMERKEVDGEEEADRKYP